MGRPPYGGDRPQRGFIRKDGEDCLGRPPGNPSPTRFYTKAIDGAIVIYIILSTVIRSIDIQPKMIPNIP